MCPIRQRCPRFLVHLPFHDDAFLWFSHHGAEGIPAQKLAKVREGAEQLQDILRAQRPAPRRTGAGTWQAST